MHDTLDRRAAADKSFVEKLSHKPDLVSERPKRREGSSPDQTDLIFQIQFGFFSETHPEVLRTAGARVDELNPSAGFRIPDPLVAEIEKELGLPDLL